MDITVSQSGYSTMYYKMQQKHVVYAWSQQIFLDRIWYVDAL